jgi:hypothetical protein
VHATTDAQAREAERILNTASGTDVRGYGYVV